MLGPSLAVIALVAAYPICYAVWLSLNEYSVITPGLSRFVGLDNYLEALGSAQFWEAMETTILFTVISVGLELAIGLGMALVMHQAFRGRALLRAVVLVPWAILTVVTAITWRTIFEPELGFVNTTLSALGLPGGDVVWLGEEGYALAAMILADVWKTAPFMALLILAGLQGIPDELHDAAKVDGANTWQRFRSITLPLLVPAITVALIFRTLDALRIFDLPYVLTKGANGTETLSLIAQTELVANRNTGLGSALAVLTFITVMGISFLYIRFMGGNIRALTREEE
ncbi:MAG TPA: sugar ABC transporter permease [Solirubrobacterales bacterium]|jgi:multiple sugar transport system permease protein|nr:sugar ABC transporter permease [Solirubrobacterales bacterium]